jgi:hypothetical protein
VSVADLDLHVQGSRSVLARTDQFPSHAGNVGERGAGAGYAGARAECDLHFQDAVIFGIGSIEFTPLTGNMRAGMEGGGHVSALATVTVNVDRAIERTDRR